MTTILVKSFLQIPKVLIPVIIFSPSSNRMTEGCFRFIQFLIALLFRTFANIFDSIPYELTECLLNFLFLCSILGYTI